MKVMLAAMAVLASVSAVEAKTQQPSAAAAQYVGVLYVPLSPNRWRVGYDGRGAVDAAAVEHIVAVEAAKLALSHNFDWFQPIGEPTSPQDTKTTVDMKRQETGSHPETLFLRWGLMCTSGWSFGDDLQALCPGETGASDRRYRATTQIVMGHGETPHNGMALSAHALAPKTTPGWPRFGAPKIWPF